MNAPASIDQAPVLVTGASGFIGRHLVDELLRRGCEVHAQLRDTSDSQGIDPARVQVHRLDLTRDFDLRDCLSRVEYIFHCAGVTKGRTREEYFRINARACESFYAHCVRHARRLRGVVHLSSLAAVGPAELETPVNETVACRPVTHYGQSKFAGEAVALQYAASLPLIVLRPPVVYGPRERNFFTFLRWIRRGWNLQIGTRRRALSLIYVHDLVRAMVEAARHPIDGENVFFITDGQVYDWERVSGTAADLLNIRPRSLTIPEWALPVLAMASEAQALFHSGAPLLDRQRMIDLRQSAWTAAPQRFFDRYQFRPQYDLKSGLAESLDWYKKHRWL